MRITTRMLLGGAAVAVLLAGCNHGAGEANRRNPGDAAGSPTSASPTSASPTGAAPSAGPTEPTKPAGTAPGTLAPSQQPSSGSSAGGSSGGAGGSGAGGESASPSTCTAANLQLSLGSGDAGAGSVYRPLIFTNTGSQACHLRGFPGVSYVAGDDGHQVGPAAQMSGPRGGEVTLARGDTAKAVLRLIQVRVIDPAACKPTPVRGLRVYPPGDTASLFVPMQDLGCAGNPPGGQLAIQTILPG